MPLVDDARPEGEPARPDRAGLLPAHRHRRHRALRRAGRDRRRARAAGRRGGGKAAQAVAERANYALVLASFAVFGAYVLALPGLGFRIATFLYVTAAAALLARPLDAKRWIAILVLALLTAAITYFVFERYLLVLLPRGRWTGF